MGFDAWHRFALMALDMPRPIGQVFRVDRKRGPVWFAKYPLPDGRQVQKTPPAPDRESLTFADAANEYLRYIEHDRGR